MRRLFSLVACGLLGAAIVRVAVAAPPTEPVAIQLEVVAIQLQPARKRPIKAYFTIYLELRDAKQIEPVCRQIRSIHEVAAIAAEEFKKKSNDFAMEEVEGRIEVLIKQKFKADNFLNVYVIAQNKRPGEGSKITLLPGTTGRCLSLMRVPLDILAHHQLNKDNQLGFDPRGMLDGAYPLALLAVGKPTPIGGDESTPWLAVTIAVSATLAIGGAAGAVYERRRRARRTATEDDGDRRQGTDRRGESRGPSQGNDRRGQNDRRGGTERRGGDRRKPKQEGRQ